MENKTKLYEFTQNNSGGYFDVDENVCHRVVIEAYSLDHAIDILNPMIECQSASCPCCGDRWSPEYADAIEIDKYKEDGLFVGIYTHYENLKVRWHTLYGDFERKEDPKKVQLSWGKMYGTKLYFKDEIEYLQYIANEYGSSSPDIRVHYLDGSKKEIYKTNV